MSAAEKLIVTGNRLFAGRDAFPCAVGAGGFKTDKREGDGATPVGIFPLRRCLYRPDRMAPPQTGLPLSPLAPDDGWCDAPESQFYNLPVKIPFNQSHEVLWREDHVYDILIPIGYNDAPAEPGRGSAIFLHLARPGYVGTEGCVALSPADMRALLPRLSCGTCVEIRGP